MIQREQGSIVGGYYALAAAITDRLMAKRYLETLVEAAAKKGIARKTAERVERENIIDFASRYDADVQNRVKSLFSSLTSC